MLFSNESKYRIEVNFHGGSYVNSRPAITSLSARHRFTIGLLLLPLSSIWMWEPWFVVGQVWLQLLLFVLLVLMGWRILQMPQLFQNPQNPQSPQSPQNPQNPQNPQSSHSPHNPESSPASPIQKRGEPMVLSVSPIGQCRILSAGSQANNPHRKTDIKETELVAFPWQVSSRSRMLPGALWLSLHSGNRTQSWWLFRDEMNEKDFRRLCVVIRYCQKYPPEKHH